MKQIERLYKEIIAVSDGEHGYLSKSNLEYFLDAAKDIGESLEKKQALAKKAGFLLYNVVFSHPFVNGNKRTGYELVKLFLRLNGYSIVSPSQEVFRILLDIATGNLSAKNVEKWIGIHLIELEPKHL